MQQARAGIRRRDLMEAAERVVGRDGITALTLEAVAQEAGVTKALIPYHFGSKEGFITALIEGIIDKVLPDNDTDTSVAEAMAADLPGIDELVTRAVEIMCDREASLLFYAILPEALARPALRARLAEVYAWQRKLIAAYIRSLGLTDDEEEIAHYTILLHSVIDGMGVQYAIDPDLDVAAITATLVDRLEGLRR